MNADMVLQELLNAHTLPPIPVLPSDVAAVVVERLKAEADRHWWINANRSLQLADLIVQIGQTNADPRHTALGLMARGDALKFLGRTVEAWNALDEAGMLFERVDDAVGWARTRIGRLLICVDLRAVPEALADAAQAHSIFVAHGEHEKLLRLNLNTAIVYKLLGDHQHALELYQAAVASAHALGPVGNKYLGALYTNLGNLHALCGSFRTALEHHAQARIWFSEYNETSGIAKAEYNTAHILLAQGNYRHALQLLHRAYALYVQERLPLDAASVQRDIVECYLLLNRYTDVRDLARQVSAQFQASGNTYEAALTLLYLAMAEAELNNVPAAHAALDTAEPIFNALGATTWVATVHLRRAKIALLADDLGLAGREARIAIMSFQSSGQQVYYAEAVLLEGQTALARNDLAAAHRAASLALQVGKHCHVPALRFAAHLLLGKIAERQANTPQAIRRYHAAAATVERVQRGLTITLRPGFLQDKGAALWHLMQLQLATNQWASAFTTLERAKGQVLLNHLAYPEQLRWSSGAGPSSELLATLDQLREEHQWFNQLAHTVLTDDRTTRPGITPEAARIEVTRRERQIRTVIEQLYLHSGSDQINNMSRTASLAEIQACLRPTDLLVEWYDDGSQFWAFTIDTNNIEVHRLLAPVAQTQHLLDQLYLNISAALRSAPAAPFTSNLTRLAQRILHQLYIWLWLPIKTCLEGYERVVVVPYGALHYLPFHLLHSGSAYCIEQYEFVTLPAANLLTRRGRVCAPGARVLAHAWQDRLPHTLAEATLVHELCGGELYVESAARRTVLNGKPTQILHIAAHGEHRLEQPDLSYIELADGQMYTDDLLQHDLGYELVTLSGCETGRGHVAPGDELIGLGRGFLYAGAHAIISSLWQVADVCTVQLMETLYRELQGGASKAAALRAAQCAMLHNAPHLHPAFWGVFQLIGDPRPLGAAAKVSAEVSYGSERTAVVG